MFSLMLLLPMYFEYEVAGPSKQNYSGTFFLLEIILHHVARYGLNSE